MNEQGSLIAIAAALCLHAADLPIKTPRDKTRDLARQRYNNVET